MARVGGLKPMSQNFNPELRERARLPTKTPDQFQGILPFGGINTIKLLVCSSRFA